MSVNVINFQLYQEKLEQEQRRMVLDDRVLAFHQQPAVPGASTNIFPGKFVAIPTRELPESIQPIYTKMLATYVRSFYERHIKYWI